jgi:tRNA-dihydrouridine synthase A
VKSRIGVDDSEDYVFLKRFVETVAEAGCEVFIVHARKAWLKGLSPKENREVPPLRYEIVEQLKAEFPQLTIVINGGIRTLDQCTTHLERLDGVMLGRELYDNPYLMASVDARLFADARPALSRIDILRALVPYAEAEIARGTRLHHITRHILGLYRGQNRGRAFRRLLSDAHASPDVELLLDVIDQFDSDEPQLEAA